MTAALRHRQFRLLFAGQIVSNLGDWLDFLALAVLIAYVWHKGPAALAGLAIAIAIPAILIAPFAGVLVDRWPKRSVMILADLGRAGLVIGLVMAPSVWVVYPLVFFKATLSTFFNPAEAATIRFTLPEELLQPAVALSQLVLQATKVLGPALGGLLVGLWSPRVALGADAATFLCSAAILSRLARVESPIAVGDESEETAGPSLWRELREGVRYIATRRALLICIAGMSAMVFLLLAFDTLSPLAFRELGVSRSLFGLAVAAIGLGGVAGTILVGRWGAAVNAFALLGGGAVIVGCLVVLIGVALLANLALPPVTWVPVLLAVGVASAGVLIAAPTIMQRETPAELMGRVSATANAIPTVFSLAAPIAGSALAAWRGVGFTFTVAGGGLAVLGLVLAIVRTPVGTPPAGTPTCGPASSNGAVEVAVREEVVP
jgi:MFS family permease